MRGAWASGGNGSGVKTRPGKEVAAGAPKEKACAVAVACEGFAFAVKERRNSPQESKEL